MPFGPPPPGGPGGPGSSFSQEDVEKARKQAKTRDGEQNRRVLAWIIKTGKPYWASVIGLVVLAALNSLGGVVFALVSQETVNSATAGDAQGLVFFAVVLAIVGVLQIAIRATDNYVTERVNTRVNNGYRSRIFGYVLDRDYSQITGYHSGDLMNRVNGDVSTVVSGVTSFLPSIAEIVANLVGAGSVLLLMDWRFVVIYILATVALIVINKIFRRAIKDLSAAAREKDGRVYSFFQESIASLLVLRVFVTEGRAKERAEGLLDDVYRANLDRAKVRIKSSAAMGLSMNFGHLFALIWCSFQLLWGTMNYGQLVAILQLSGQVRQPFISASNLAGQYYTVIASAERLMEIEALDPDFTKAEQDLIESGFDARDLYASMDRLVLDGVHFSYSGREEDETLRGIDFALERGQFAAIMGQSGCGKSTLFKLMLGVLKPQAGVLAVEGSGSAPAGATALDADTWRCALGATTRRLFAYVPQGNMLISGRLRDNIAFTDYEVSDDDIWAALRIACADEFVARLPQGLETVIGEHGQGLSEGQTQRIAVARAYLSGAPILLLDEATSALDDETEAKMLANLRALNDRTCLIVTHRKAALSICDKTLMVQRDSGLVALDSQEEAIARSAEADGFSPSGPPSGDGAFDRPGPDGPGPDGLGPDGFSSSSASSYNRSHAPGSRPGMGSPFRNTASRRPRF